MNKILTVILILACLGASVLGAGCTSNGGGVGEHYLAQWTSGVVGWTFTLNVSVRVDQSQVYDVGDLHYRDYTVTTTATPGRDLEVQMVTDRTVANPHITGEILYNDLVANWAGTYWNRGWNNDAGQGEAPSEELAAVHTGSEQGDDVYDIPKPSKYVMALGYTYTFQETLSEVEEQVATYLRFTVEELMPEGMEFEYKVPFMATIPRFTSSLNYIINWYEITIYQPIGGKILENIPDQFEIKAFTTTQHLKAGYTQAVYSLTGPQWDDLLIAGAIALCVPVYGWVAAIGYLWAQEDYTTYAEYAGSPRPNGLELKNAVEDFTPKAEYVGGNLHAIVDVTTY
jgi:hypothetical protein